MELKKVFRESRNRVRLWIVGIFAFLTIAFMVVVSQAERNGELGKQQGGAMIEDAELLRLYYDGKQEQEDTQ